MPGKNTPVKNIEVEIRAIIDDAPVVRKTLKNLGAQYVGQSYLRDIYFCDKQCSSLIDVEMHEVDSYSLRLRKAKKASKELITLNTKTITKQGDHNAWEEHESEVKDFQETAKMLVLTEFKPFFDLEKTRYQYTFDGLNIFVEDIKGFGSCIEVEIITNLGDETNSKSKILKFLVSLGISENNIVPKSVTNIVMHQRAFQTEILIN